MASEEDVAKFGFDRTEMYQSPLSNTVDAYDRHVFLCYKTYDSWPSRIENSDTDLLPKLLSSALKARKDDIKVKTRVTICGGCSGTDCSDGDVLIFPEMMKYRGLKESDVDGFVEDVLVNEKPWASGEQEQLAGAFVFICAHAQRDKRCGVCGPILIDKFKEELASRGLDDQVFVSACSHIGGHKYAGNVIIFGTDAEGKVTGDWYGYVTPADVPDIIDLAIGRGEIIQRLWRGQMGLYSEDADKGAEKKEKKHEEKDAVTVKESPTETKAEEIQQNASSCCQGVNGGVTCCRDGSSAVNGEAADAVVEPKKASESSEKKKLACMPAGFGKWEQHDVLMAAGVVGAVATVAVAYSFYRRSG